MPLKKLSSKRGKNKELSADEQEKALSEMKGRKEKGRFYGRVTIDLSHDLYDNMKSYIKDDGRTMKGYLKKLIQDDLKEKGYM